MVVSKLALSVFSFNSTDFAVHIQEKKHTGKGSSLVGGTDCSMNLINVIKASLSTCSYGSLNYYTLDLHDNSCQW